MIYRTSNMTESHIRRRPVGIIDNDKRSLDSLCFLCENELSFRIQTTPFTDGVEALHASPTVDLWIVDMSLEGIQGPVICRRIRQKDAITPILAVTCFSLNRYRDKAFKAGAQGLVDKNVNEHIAHAVADLLSGTSMAGFDTPHTAHQRVIHEKNSLDLLSQREMEVLELIADEGLLDGEVAQRLGIAPSTVRKHMQHVLDKLNAKTARQAVAYWLSEANR